MSAAVRNNVLLRGEDSDGRIHRREHDARTRSRATPARTRFDEAFYVLDGELPFS
jgi:hypothetical protein